MNRREEPIKLWGEPVYLRVGMRSPQTIHDAAEALAFLERDWVGAPGKRQFASEICSAAVLRQVSGETAREAFIDAVSEARIDICAPNASV